MTSEMLTDRASLAMLGFLNVRSSVDFVVPLIQDPKTTEISHHVWWQLYAMLNSAQIGHLLLERVGRVIAEILER